MKTSPSKARPRPLTKHHRSALLEITRRWKEAPLLVKSATLLSLRERGLLEMRIKPVISNIVGAAMRMPYHCFPYEWRLTKEGKKAASVVRGDVHIETTGDTVWVNRERCIGRFGRHAVDVHTQDSIRGSGGTETLPETTIEDWHRFKESMRKTHGVTVDNKHAPDRFKRERCPTCAKPVLTIFDHLGEDCQHE